MSKSLLELHPRAQSLANQLVTECLNRGLEIEIINTVTNAEEQAECVRVGDSCLFYANSMHNWGVAFDVRSKEKVDPFNPLILTQVGLIGKNLGLEWGGTWKSPVKVNHFQLPDWGIGAQQLISLYGTPKKFKDSWEIPKVSKVKKEVAK